MECDDLKSVLTRFTPGQPSIPPSQVHIVMWERNLTTGHARRLTDTTHTNLLASLVLTVQYPSSATSSSVTQSASPGSLLQQGVCFIFTLLPVADYKER